MITKHTVKKRNQLGLMTAFRSSLKENRKIHMNLYHFIDVSSQL